MKLKRIENKYYKKFCEVLETYYSGAVEKCSATMKEASLDDSNKKNYVYVYNYDDYDMEVLKLDEFSKLYNPDNSPSAVDAICIDSENNWYLIEFKNSEFKGKTLNSVKKKMLSSLWLLFYTYSITKNISYITENLSYNDIIKFSREHIVYIVVCSSDKNLDIASNIQEAEDMNEHYIPRELKHYIGYYFKNVYLYNEQAFKKFIVNFK